MTKNMQLVAFAGLFLMACATDTGSTPPGSSGTPPTGSTPPGTGGGGGATPPGSDAGSPADGGSAPIADAGSGGGSTPPGAASVRPVDWPEARAWRWVRDNPMFISGLVSQMGAPPRSAVDRYFDEWNANAIHLWESALPEELIGWQAHRPGARWLTWLHGDGTVVRNRLVLGGHPADSPGRIGYQLGDEPRTWESMNEILGGLEAVRRADPNGLRVVNFSWWADELDDYIDAYCDSGSGDIISYDMYSRSNTAMETLAYFREQGLRCGMPYWRYIKGIPCSDGPQSEADMRWDAFTGLTFGYTGHSWFIYHVDNGHELGIPSSFFPAERWGAPTSEGFHWSAQINTELAVYGRAMTQLLSRDVAWMTDLPFTGVHPPAGTPLFRPEMDPYLEAVELDGFVVDALLGFFVDVHGDRYVIVQNPNHDGGSFPTDDTDRITGHLRFDFSGATGVDTTRVMVLDGRTGRVRDEALTDGALALDIAAGDILFFKYDTGRSFAGY